MAQFKYGNYLEHSDQSSYDAKLPPGALAPNPGIYRCVVCGHEIAIAKGHTLPPQNHHQHTSGLGKIEWQLLVFAQSQRAP